MEYSQDEDILPTLPWKEVSPEDPINKNTIIYYFALTTCVYCKRGMKWLDNMKAHYYWIYLDELPMEQKKAVRQWVKEKYKLRTDMASPCVIFRTKNKDYISNGYDREYWKTKLR